MREMDGAPNVEDGRRLEVVVDGLPLFGGGQIAVDTTMVGALHGNGFPRREAADRDGVALTAARKRKDDRYPELVGARSRTRLVVLASEVGGRWSVEASPFVSRHGRARKSHCCGSELNKLRGCGGVQSWLVHPVGQSQNPCWA